MTHTLKLKGDLTLPGLALPQAFQSLDAHLESVMQLCTAKSSPEAQLVGVVTVCEELQQLLKCAFIENGLLASRIEILTRYHTDSMKKYDKKISDMDTENKITHKHMKRLRKKLNTQQVLQKKKSGEWWDMKVRTTDYDSFVTLSRAGGYPDLEFMLRVNQLMIDFVTDSSRTELVLPPMGLEERQEVSKLASIYKLRCRYGKSVQTAPSTLLKARQACVPAPGEVDAILNNFTRTHTQRKATEEVVTDEKSTTGKELSGGSKDEPTKPPSISLPSTMLTPISNLPSPTVDVSAFKQPSHSPPSSGLATPTEGPIRFLKQRDSFEMVGGVSEKKASVATQSGPAPITVSGTRPELQTLHPRQDHKKGKTIPKEPSTPRAHHTPTEGKLPSTIAPSATSPAVVSASVSNRPQVTSLPTHPPSSPSHLPSPIGIVLAPPSAAGSHSPGSSILLPPSIRGMGGVTPSTVLASPIKCHPPQLSPDLQSRNLRKEREKESREKEEAKKKEKIRDLMEEVSKERGNGGVGGGGGGGGGSARTDTMGPPVKRVRVTRRSVAEEEQARQ